MASTTTQQSSRGITSKLESFNTRFFPPSSQRNPVVLVLPGEASRTHCCSTATCGRSKLFRAESDASAAQPIPSRSAAWRMYIVPFYSCALTHCDRAVRTCFQYRNPSTPLCVVLFKHFSVRISRLSYRNWPSAGAPVGQSGVFSFLDGGSRLRLKKHTTGNVGSATIITRLDQRRHNLMAMKKSDYLSDVWKDGIFSKPCRSQGL